MTQKILRLSREKIRSIKKVSDEDEPKDTTSSIQSTSFKAKPNCLRFDQWQHMLLNAAITEFKLHAFSLVQTTIGFCKLCRTGSPVYHVVFNQVFSRVFGENLRCPCGISSESSNFGVIHLVEI